MDAAEALTLATHRALVRTFGPRKARAFLANLAEEVLAERDAAQVRGLHQPLADHENRKAAAAEAADRVARSFPTLTAMIRSQPR